MSQGVAGSIAAKFLAKSGLKIIFVEKQETPRHKTCSGIQFNYFSNIDQVRGVGMDAAALSGRIAARSILSAEEDQVPVLEKYKTRLEKLIKQTRKNQEMEIFGFQTNNELQRHLNKNMFKMGLG